MKTIKYKFWVGLTFVLAVSLMAGACAPAAPTGEEGAEEIAKLEGDLAASEKKVKSLEGDVDDLEDEIAELKKPVKVQKWEPSTWTSAGGAWDGLVYMADYVTAMSDGRLVLTPTAAGAIIPVDETLDAVALGTTEALSIAPGYFPGKIPLCYLYGDAFALLPSVAAMYELNNFWEGGRIRELAQEEFSKYGDIHIAGEYYRKSPSPIYSKVPMYRVADVAGVPFRSAHFVAEAMAVLGASTVWSPGSEIYTLLATGVVDAVTYDDAATALGLSWHEVTSYWIRTPILAGVSGDPFIVNQTVWNELPDDLKAIVTAGLEAAWGRQVQIGELADVKAWKFAEDYGIEMIDWPEEDWPVFFEAFRSLLPAQRDDPAKSEWLDIVERFMLEQGYWE